VEAFSGEPAQQQGCLLASYGNAKYFNNLCCCWDWINSHSPENSSLEKKTRSEEHEGKLSQRGSRYATYILSSSQKKERKKERKKRKVLPGSVSSQRDSLTRPEACRWRYYCKLRAARHGRGLIPRHTPYLRNLIGLSRGRVGECFGTDE
jgi:hypothetical protein